VKKKRWKNQLFIKMPDNIICIDTDEKDAYDKLTNYINDKNLYLFNQ
jgi:hypothetical protein